MGPSYVGLSPACAASAAESGAKRKEEKYIEISRNYHFFPIAFEAFGPIYQIGKDFISAMGHQIPSNTDDPRETFVVILRHYVAIQHFNTDTADCMEAMDCNRMALEWLLPYIQLGLATSEKQSRGEFSLTLFALIEVFFNNADLDS